MLESDGVDIKSLKWPIKIDKLLDIKGTTFELTSNFEDEDIERQFLEEVEGFDNANEVNPALLVSPWTETFDELRLLMEPVNEFIHKNITTPGNKTKGLITENSRVAVHYNAYWEGEGAPFDSSFLRGSTYKFYTNQHDVLEGLEMAIKTMYEGEKAEFLISYKVLYHEMGCPPRVKPKADALFIIELVSFYPVGNLEAISSLKEEERKKFPVVLQKVKELHLKGLDFYGQRMYKNACTAFIRATDALAFCHITNSDEMKEQTNFLIKLYTNLAVCYNKIHEYRQTLAMVKEIRRLTDKPSCKALFQEGRALLEQGEYDAALGPLQQAQKIEPKNKDINRELIKLGERQAKYKIDEMNLWKNAFTQKSKLDENQQKIEKPDIFEQNMNQLLQELKDNTTEHTIVLPDPYNERKMNTMKKLTEKFGFNFSISPFEKGKCSISKK